MTKYDIGMNAGTVWHSLEGSCGMTFDELRQASGLVPNELYAAISWLAREGKIEIEYDRKAGAERFYPPHCNMYY